MGRQRFAFFDGFAKNPISALRFMPGHCGVLQYAAFGTRDSAIPRDSHALISDYLRNRLKHEFISNSFFYTGCLVS
jgi:hypothetical protein